jgi:hypothetical protein
LFASTHLTVGMLLAQNLYRSVYDGTEGLRRSLVRAGNGCAPVHRRGWGICGEIDPVAAPSDWQDPVHFPITFMAFGPDLPEYELHSRGPCRLPVMDHVRARTDPNRDMFLPVGDTSRPWQHIQRHLIAEVYCVQQISFGVRQCRS